MTALDRGIPPVEYGKRLISPKDGLRVKQAQAGSLDVEFLFGGLYTLVTSQPVSFVLNLATLIGWTKAAIRAYLPGGQREVVEVEVPPNPRPGEGGIVHTPHGTFLLPEAKKVRLEMESADGSRFELEIEPPDS